MNSQVPEKSDVAKREEKILAFWKEHKTFKKSEEKDAPKGEFIFYDGPPFATGLPHHGSLLSSVIKDVVPRYKTMQGYRVLRRWGWDCHGLPIENLVEKKLGLKTKKDIEKIGVAKFNSEARKSVMEFAHEWENYIDRVGRWVDFKNDYKTMDTSFIESVWWGLSQMNEKGLLYEGRKVLMYCPHDETPLAKAEIAADNTYKDITEEAVTVKLKVKDAKKYDLPENTYLLAWTTTPWTLPGNVALAVGADIDYSVIYQSGKEEVGMNFTETGGTHYIVAKALAEKIFTATGKSFSSERDMKGSALIGIEYEPLFEVPLVAAHKGKKYVVLPADFVSTEEGTGIVHTAVMYGEDDFALGQKEGLPMVQLLTPSATYNDAAPVFLRGRYIKEAETDIKSDLEKRELLFTRAHHTHSYPHCWRCGTPLIYNAVSSWFLNIQKVKEKMLGENEKVTWVPGHLKHGRFKNIVESAPDWTISRNRYWASPLPIWKDKNGKVRVIGTLAELLSLVPRSGNSYFMLRHGLSELTSKGVTNGSLATKNPLTEEGRVKVEQSGKEIAEKKIDLILVSPVERARETAEIIRLAAGLPKEALIIDPRLTEVDFGNMEGRQVIQWVAQFENFGQRFTFSPGGGETYKDVRRRVMEALFEYEKKYRDKRILIVSHGGPLWLMRESAKLMSQEEMAAVAERKDYLDVGEWAEFPFTPYPHNEDFELDLHRPYIDEVSLIDERGEELKRIPEVIDCWVESGSMPFAQHHYLGEALPHFNPKGGLFSRRKGYPADFIAEYIAQTRTWFYYMHAVGTLLFGRTSFKNVVSTGNLLATDGSKMSKSKGNYTDPLLLLHRYGADAYRFYLMASVVMQSEDVEFRDEDVRDVHNRVIGMLWNSYKFFELYKKEVDTAVVGRKSQHILDRWMFARLDQTTKEVTEAFDSYDTPRVCRTLRAFIEDYSTWYLRRSRERVKGEDMTDKKYALAAQREALTSVAKLAAPIMPFIAESIFQGIEGEGESVHLCAWPNGGSVEGSLLENMKKVRQVVTLGLEARAKAGIRVRQPLAKITSKLEIPDAYKKIVEEELNVKELQVDTALSEPVRLDTKITPELQREGDIRELLRALQDMRKEKKLSPSDRISILFEAPEHIQKLIEEHAVTIHRVVLADEINFGKVEGEVIELALGTLIATIAKK